MADLCDVEAALVEAVLTSCVVGQGPFPILSGIAVRVYRGTPEVTALTQDGASCIVEIAIFPIADATRNTTRWGRLATASSVASGLSATVAGQTAGFSGVAVAGELAGILVDGNPYVYQAQAGDSADLVAAALAQNARATQIVTVQGASLTIPGATTLVARTAGVATVFEECGRQEQDFRVSIFAPSPSARDNVCRALGSALSLIAFLALADGTAGWLRYQKTASCDGDQVASIYRRDLVYSVEYATTVTLSVPAMLFGDIVYNKASTYI